MALNQGYAYREQVGAEGVGLTASAYLALRHPRSSLAVWEKRVAAGQVSVGADVAAVGTRLCAGAWLTWHRPAWDEPEVPLSFDVVAEDEQILVVSKPSGLPTAPAGGFLQHTLLALVRARDPAWSPLHRLGRGTSGLVLFARGTRALAALSQAWREARVEKDYLALAEGEPALDRFVVEAPIGPVEHPLLGTLHAASPTGRPSRSEVQVLERRGDSTLCAVRIPTGRPHQIRIHLAFVGHPLVGDPLYVAGGLAQPGVASLPGDGGYWLHAHRLAFPHPVTGERRSFEAQPPIPLQRRGISSARARAATGVTGQAGLPNR